MPVYHWIALGVQTIGLGVVVSGIVRIIRAPIVAARRAGAPAHEAADGARYARGLVDFYRMSGAIAVLAGVLLLLVPLFAS